MKLAHGESGGSNALCISQMKLPNLVIMLLSCAALAWCISVWHDMYNNRGGASSPEQQADTRRPRSDSVPKVLTDADQEKGAAAARMDAWVTSGQDTAISLFDGRAIDAAKGLARVTKLNRFDGKIVDVGEDTITIIATGDQYPVEDFSVTPVAEMDSSFLPMRFTISVAKDSKKVIAVQGLAN